MVWIAVATIGSAVIGGSVANSASKRDAANQQAAIEAQMAGFNLAKPYVEQNYKGGEEALNASLSSGAYSGQTLAGPNVYSTDALNYAGNTGLNMQNGATDLINQGQGFGSNFNSLYGQAQGGNQMQTAQNYATANSQPLIDAAMRDDRRNLTENTLTGINMNASGTGNMNSSRAGVADAIANRGYADRSADTTATINDQLMNRSLTQQNTNFDNSMSANAGISDTYSQGINAAGAATDFGTKAGAGLQGFDQAALTDAQNNSNAQRDFALDQQIKYNAGILNNSPMDVGQVNPVTANSATAGFGGAMAGAGIGMDLYNKYKASKAVSGSQTPAQANSGAYIGNGALY
jgi:hypothetical protein